MLFTEGDLLTLKFSLVVLLTRVGNFRSSIPLCALINRHLNELAMKFPTVKFIKSIAATCIPNYPEKNLPTIFVYFEGTMIHKFIGPNEFCDSISVEGK